MPKRLPLLIGLLCLASCALVSPSEPVPTANPCRMIPLPDVSQVTRDKLADEVDAAPAGAVWPEVVQQWVALRAEVRACRG